MVGQTVQDTESRRLKLPAVGPASVWRLFTSVRLAVVLILLISLASLGGVLLVQAPAAPEVDPTGYDRWLSQIRDKYGTLTGLFDSVGLFRVFTSWWFQLLLALLAINTAVCTVDRSGKVVKRSFGTPSVEMPEKFFVRAALRSRMIVSGITEAQSDQIVKDSLRGYRIKRADSDGRTSFYADRWRMAPLGTLVHHAALVGLILGFAAMARWGDDFTLVVAEGDMATLGADSNLAIRLETFTDEYYVSGPPKDYVSDVVLYEDGVEIRRSSVRVNSPLVYKGTRLHQSFFGIAVEVAMRDSSGRVIVEERVPLAWRVGERPFGSFVVPSEQLEIYVIGPASTFIDEAIPAGQVRVEVYQLGNEQPYALGNVAQGETTELGGLNYEFLRETQFSGFQVVRNPARPLLWGASIAFVVGLIWVLYLKPRQLWAQRKKIGDNTYEISFGAAKGKRNHFEGPFNGIARRSERQARAIGSIQEFDPKEIL